MIIVIKIQEIWQRYEEESLALKNVGISVEEAVHLAFGFAALSTQPVIGSSSHRAGYSIFTIIRNKLFEQTGTIDRPPLSRGSGYGLNIDDDRKVFWVVDVIGEISRMLADAVIHQLGSFPPQLRLLRFIGPDPVLIINEEHSVPHHLS